MKKPVAIALFIIALLAALPALAQNVKISTLIPATLPLTGTELFYVVQGGVSKRTPLSSIISGGSSLTVGSTLITGGTPGDIEFNNAGVLGEKGVTGTGSVVLATSPSIASPTITGAFTAPGLVTVADLVSPSTTVNGQTCTLGSTCTIPLTAALVVGTSTITGGTSGNIEFNNAGVLGEKVVTGTGSVVLSASPVLTGTLTAAAANFTGPSNTPTTDGSVSGIFNSAKTAANVYSGIVPGGYAYFDNTRSVIDLESGTTVTNGNGFGAYCYDNIAAVGGAHNAACVGYFSVGVAVANGANVFGSNPVLNDSLTNSVSAGTGKILVGSEYDITVTSPSTVVEGISFIMQGPSTAAAATGVQISTNSTAAKWTNAFVSNSGAATVALNIGALTASSVANTSSQPSFYSIWDSAGAAHGIILQAVPSGTNSAFQISDNTLANGLVFSNAASGSGPFVIAAGSDTNIDLNLLPKGTGVVDFDYAGTTTCAATASISVKIAGVAHQIPYC